MRVLSLFDGIACGYEALVMAGIPIDAYYASEIDKYAIQIAMKNHPDIIQVGDVTKLKGEDFKDVDMIIGGSPCQGFSMAGKMLNFNDPRSKLFFEFVRLVKEIKPKYFLLENVRMKKEWIDVISKELGVEPICINSALVSAQNRIRYYRTNIPGISQPEDRGILLKDVLEEKVDDKFYLTDKQISMIDNWKGSLTSNCASGGQKNMVIIQRVRGCAIRNQVTKNGIEAQLNVRKDEKSNCVVSSYADKLNQVKIGGSVRKLTPIECERLQTMPDNYTEGVSDTQRYKMLGNGWTVDVIAHIFSFIKTDNG